METIRIEWGDGVMSVNLKEFLSCRSISKVKKLVKIIRESFTPNCEMQIREFVEQEIEQYEPRRKDAERHIVGYRQKVDYLDSYIYTASAYRDRYKKNSTPWKHHNDDLKRFKEEQRELKKQLISWQRKLNENQKNQEFYMKVLEIIG